MLDVLDAAHARGVVHRDIKPDNLFVTDDGLVKVLDFGVARLFEHIPGATIETRDGSTLGTPAFMAQEQARGRWDEVDARTDLWALGATLFTLCSGQVVHPAETANEQLGKAMSTPARSLGSHDPELPELFVATVDRALAFDREKRFADAASMQAALRRCFSPEQLESREQRQLERSTQLEPSISDFHATLPDTDGGKHDTYGLWSALSHASLSTSHTARMRVLALLGLALLTALAIQRAPGAPREHKAQLVAATAVPEPSAVSAPAVPIEPTTSAESTRDAVARPSATKSSETLAPSASSTLHISVRPTAAQKPERSQPLSSPRPKAELTRAISTKPPRAERELPRQLPNDLRATWPDPLDRRH